jgi:mono/diheme cytochrome c family protein
MQAWSRESVPHTRQENQEDKELIAKGKKAYGDYRCFDCHGQNGEGTYDGPDLTVSHLTAAEISKFLQRPSADADARGMPTVPATSPDHQPLVAYVLSLRRPPPK